MKVRDIMTMNPSTAEIESTIEEIATLMKEADVGAIPILDDDRDLAGIVTDRDIVVRCIAEGRDPSECRAEDILQTQVEADGSGLQTADPEMDVREAAQIMSQFQIRRLPVVDGGKLVGMLSLGDLAVKSGDEQMSGDALEDISEGVKEQGHGKTAQKKRTAKLKSEPSPKKQRVTSHSAREESARQNKVVPIKMKKVNRVRNRHVTPPMPRKKAS